MTSLNYNLIFNKQCFVLVFYGSTKQNRYMLVNVNKKKQFHL